MFRQHLRWPLSSLKLWPLPPLFFQHLSTKTWHSSCNMPHHATENLTASDCQVEPHTPESCRDEDGSRDPSSHPIGA